jgi:hypothetical protein
MANQNSTAIADVNAAESVGWLQLQALWTTGSATAEVNAQKG